MNHLHAQARGGGVCVFVILFLPRLGFKYGNLIRSIRCSRLHMPTFVLQMSYDMSAQTQVKPEMYLSFVR